MPEYGQTDYRIEASQARQYIETCVARIIEKYIFGSVDVHQLIPPNANKKITKQIDNYDNDFDKKNFVIQEITAHDKVQVLLKNIKYLPIELRKDIEDDKHNFLFTMGEARAKTDAHTYLDRPIPYDIYKSVITFMHARVDTKLDDWELLKEFFEEIQKISFEEENIDEVLVNVPSEDYKITNFCGRSEVFNKAYQLIVEQERYLVSLIGIGGYGKTALANYVVRHISKKHPGLFKKIFWYSAKDSYIDESGKIEKIIDPIKSLNDFIESPDDNNPYSIDEYLNQEGNILIVLDNFETMDEENAKAFIKKYASPRCRFIVTSRKSLGELEEKINIERMQDFEAKLMLDNYISTFNLNLYKDVSEDQIMAYLNKLDNSPLHIKWFLGSVKKNNNIYELMSSGKRSDLIQYTFKNTVNDLSDSSKKIIDILRIKQTYVSILFIKLLIDITDIEFENCLKELKQSVLIEFKKQRIAIRSEAMDYFSSIGYEVSDLIPITKKIHSLTGNAMSFLRTDDYSKDDFTLAEKVVARDENEAYAASQLLSIYYEFRKKFQRDQSNQLILPNKDFEKKINKLKSLKSLMIDYPEIDYAISNTYFEQYDYSNAKTYAMSGYNNCKNSLLLKRRLLHKLCIIYDKMHDYENLLIKAKELCEIDKSPRSLIQLAQAYNEIRDIDKSNEVFLEAIAGIPSCPYEINASALATQIIGAYKLQINAYVSKAHYEKYWPKLESITLKLIKHFDLPLIKLLQSIAGAANYKYSKLIQIAGLNPKIDFYNIFKELHKYFVKNEPGSPCEEYLKNIDLSERITRDDILGSINIRTNKQKSSIALDFKDENKLTEFTSLFFSGKIVSVMEAYSFVSIDPDQENYEKLNEVINLLDYQQPGGKNFFVHNSAINVKVPLYKGQSVKVQFSYNLKKEPEKRIFAKNLIL